VNLRGTTVILATHDRDTIHRVGRRVLTLDRGQLVGDQELLGTDPPVLEPLDETTAVEVPDDAKPEAGPLPDQKETGPEPLDEGSV
jgi:ABC-type methionine transport system ATPase subunit